MVDAPEPAAGDATDRAVTSDPSGPRRRARKLDRRTVAICVCIAVIGAAIAGLGASVFLGGDDASSATGQMDLVVDEAGVREASFLDVPLTTVEGEPTRLADYVDVQPVVLNFWQSSCLPCIREMPLLEAAQAANPGFTFIGVATEDVVAKATELADQTGITYPWLLDPSGDLYYAANAAGMPTTILVSPEGDIVATETGAFDSAAELQAFIDENWG